MDSVLARNWWAFAIRGVLGILFGIIAFTLPHVTIVSLVLVFAAYAIFDGVFAIVAAVRAISQREPWLLFLLEGVAGIAAGIISVMWPHITVLFFVTLIAIWALISGGFMLAAALRLDAKGRWWLAIGGVASIIYGAILLVAPLIGALVLIWWIGAYALVFGISILIAAFRLRALD